MAKNIEIKARISDPTFCIEKARSLSKSEPEIIKQNDTLFNCQSGRLKLRIFSSDHGEVQLAVSAMRTGVEVLLAEVGVRPDKVVHTYVAGGFGSSLRSSSLMKLGVLPPGVGGVVEPVGNVAGRGARLVASNPDLLREARRIAGAVRHVRIEESATFIEGFIRNTGFPPVEH